MQAWLSKRQPVATAIDRDSSAPWKPAESWGLLPTKLRCLMSTPVGGRKLSCASVRLLKGPPSTGTA